MPTTSVSIELRGLGYALDAPLLRGSIVVQGTNSRIRRVEGTGVVRSPVAGEATVSFDLVSLAAGFRDRNSGTIRISDPAARIDVSVDVELSEARGRPVQGICCDPEQRSRPCIERQIVGVGPAPGRNAAGGTHRGSDAQGRPFLLVWSVDDGGALPDMATLRDVRRIAPPGFGSDRNLMAWSMAVFRDTLYVGTCNWRFDEFRDWEKWAFSRGPIDTSEGAEVWRMQIPAGRGAEAGTWTRVLRSGLGDPYNHGIRNMTVVGDHLYAITANHTNGFEIWRTSDGRDWGPVMTGGFGNKANTSGRGLVVFDGRIYVGTENKDSGAEIWRAPVERAGKESDWERVLGDDVSRSWYAELTPFEGHLYAASLMTYTSVAENDALGDTHPGCFILRSRNGVDWEVVMADAFGSTNNQGMISSVVFRDRIYFGTTNVSGGEIHSSADGVKWELSLKLTGFRDWHAWKMYVFNDRLYCGLGRLEYIWWSGLGLYSTGDGREWVQEMDGSVLAHYGLRTMAEYRGRLYLGTASFPDCAYVIEAQRA
jgi:hypothetical protein